VTTLLGCVVGMSERTFRLFSNNFLREAFCDFLYRLGGIPSSMHVILYLLRSQDYIRCYSYHVHRRRVRKETEIITWDHRISSPNSYRHHGCPLFLFLSHSLSLSTTAVLTSGLFVAARVTTFLELNCANSAAAKEIVVAVPLTEIIEA
jgi:hypothetical protein